MPMQEPVCPYYRPPRLCVDLATDKVYEGSAMCDLVDQYCLVEHGEITDCEEYLDFLDDMEEQEREERQKEIRDNCPLAGGSLCCEDCDECNQ